MTYAIISVGGKQYRVREGERLLVDRIGQEAGSTFSPPVLLIGGDGAPTISPSDVTVTATVLGEAKGPKIRIGKYRQRTGYRRHTGFRASLTQIEIASIGGKKARSTSAKSEPKVSPAPAETATGASPAEAPAGFEDLTIAQIKEATGSWTAAELAAALAYEQAHANRKGALAALESAIEKGAPS
jgi:large subunit ribosomal protein L21